MNFANFEKISNEFREKIFTKICDLIFSKKKIFAKISFNFYFDKNRNFSISHQEDCIFPKKKDFERKVENFARISRKNFNENLENLFESHLLYGQKTGAGFFPTAFNSTIAMITG